MGLWEIDDTVVQAPERAPQDQVAAVLWGVAPVASSASKSNRHAARGHARAPAPPQRLYSATTVPRSRAAVRRRAEHPEDEVAALAQHGVLAVDLAQRAQQRGVARAREAAGDDLAPAAVPAVLALLLPRVRG